MNLKHIGENIRKRRKELGLTIMEIKQITGISNGNLSGIENGKSAPSAQAIIALSKALHCSTDYLLLDNQSCNSSIIDNVNLSSNESTFLERFNSLDSEDQIDVLDYLQYKSFQAFKRMDNSKLSIKDKKTTSISKQPLQSVYETSSPDLSSIVSEDAFYYPGQDHTISVLGYVAAGEPILSYENTISTIVPENSKASYALIAKGNSMDPIIMDGEVIEVISQKELENGEIGIIKVDNAVTCKCFYSLDERYILKSLNPDIEPIIIPKDPLSNVQIVGKVALTEQQQKRYNLLYKKQKAK